MRVLALVPARGGSRRIPRKNLEEIHGVPLVGRAVRAARAAFIIERVYVSTEDAEIAAVARRYGAAVVDRPAELAGDDVRMEAVVAHFVQAEGVDDADALVLLEPTAPLRDQHDIEAAVHLLLRAHCQAVRLVAAVKLGCHPAAYRDAGLASVIKVGAFRESGCLFPLGTVLLHRGDSRSLDVDEPADLERARALAEPG